MRVAILHFHLRPGGVTRVIELAVEALMAKGVEVLVLSGEPAPAGCRVPLPQVVVVPELAYHVGAHCADALREKAVAACRAWWGSDPNVWHIHNHALGKNFALPRVVSAWADEGCALVLQLHDFAENGRPQNYRKLRENLGGRAGLSQVLYPVGARVRYAFLNSADGARMAAAGLSEGWEILPNPIALPAEGEPCRASELGAERTLVYPTRAIRRKNLGEALLWAALAETGEKVVLTAAPQTGQDVLMHENWEKLSTELGLPVLFDAQVKLQRPAGDFVSGADRCLTTSVAEGFGMAFLEPWLAGCPVVGRDLPGSTDDFRRAGVVLDDVYSRLEFPTEWLDTAAVETMVEELVKTSCEAYETPFSKSHLASALGAVHRNGFLDFGRLNEELQGEVLRGICSGKFSKDHMRPPALKKSMAHLAHNRSAIATHFSTDLYGQRLVDGYDRVANAPAGKTSSLNAQAVLEKFLCFEDFSALRS